MAHRILCIVALAVLVFVLGGTPPSASLFTEVAHRAKAISDTQPNGLGVPRAKEVERGSSWTHPEGLPLEHKSLGQALSEARHAVSELLPAHAAMPHNAGAKYFAANPGQKITARFMNDGSVKFGSWIPGDDWELAFSQRGPKSTPKKVANARVEIGHGEALTEWFANSPKGIEHGFTVHSPAADADLAAPGLQLAVQLNGDLRATNASESESGPGDLDLVDPQGERVLAYRGLEVWDANGERVRANMAASESGILFALNTAGATFPLTVDPFLVRHESALLPEITGTGTVDGDFGFAVSLSGDTALVGDHNDRNRLSHARVLGYQSGTVYAFVLEGGEWILQQRIEPQDVNEIHFGYSVSLDGDTALIGAPDTNTEAGIEAGSAFVFTRSDGVWTQQQQLIPDDSRARTEFGNAVSLDGDTALIGAWKDYTAANVGSGTAYVFKREAEVWTQEQKLEPPDGVRDDTFGHAVCVEGDVALIGAPESRTDGGVRAGSVYSYLRDGDEWLARGKCEASDSDTNGRFGTSISMSGSQAIIGSPHHDSNDGAAYIFEGNLGFWNELTKLTGGSSGHFGRSVDLEGSTAVVGASTHDTADGVDKGLVYVFNGAGAAWNLAKVLRATMSDESRYFGHSVSTDGGRVLAGSWIQTGFNGEARIFDGNAWANETLLSAGDDASHDRFGYAVSVDGDAVLIGAPWDYTPSGGYDSGRAYLFRRSGESWELEQSLDSEDLDYRDHFGNSVSLSGDVALVGAYNESSPGFPSGSAYVFRNAGDRWMQEQRLEGLTWGGNFGWSVSADGDTIAIGAPKDDDNLAEERAGAVYLFADSGGQWAMTQQLHGDGGLSDFGYSVSLDADTLAVGAPRDNDDAGRTFVFARTEATWARQQKIEAHDAEEDDLFGSSVCVSGDTILIGSPDDWASTGIDTGSAYVYVRDASVWQLQQKLLATDVSNHAEFGISVDMDGDTAVVGAQIDSGAGSASIFTRSEGVWLQRDEVQRPGRLGMDDFGFAVSISGDTALVGGPFVDGLDTLGGVAFDQGSVHVFRILTDVSLLELWRQTHFGITESVGIAADDFDANGNGLTNLLDFAFGIDPVVAGAPESIVISGDALIVRGTLTVHRQPALGQSPYRLRFLQRRESGLAYQPQFSSAVGEWFDSPSAPAVIASDDEMDVLEVAFPLTLPDGQQARFGRVRVEVQ